jgi:hypothetical protein
MEGALPSHDNRHPNVALVEGVLNAIAAWVNKYRSAVGAQLAHGQCGPDEVRQTANDLGVSATQIRELMNKGPGAADLLGKLLLALHVDPQEIAKTNPAVLRDLQRLCITCANKKQCAHELARGTAAEHFRDYCPNAFTLDALFAAKHPSTRH